MSAVLDLGSLGDIELLDHVGTDWHRVREVTYLLHQEVRYDYAGPVRDLQQRLLLVPPEGHGDQRVVLARLDVSPPPDARVERSDGFGNTMVELWLADVEETITFSSWAVLERRSSASPHRVRLDSMYLQPTRLTAPDDALRAAAADLVAEGPGGTAGATRGAEGRALAERICQWVDEALTYQHGVTNVFTPAAEALAGGRGVCQDDAHVMLALCRLAGLAARYVSGHLLGEGGSHAWVEVLLPDDGVDDGMATVVPLDPCNGRAVGLEYVTVAVGRDYADAAPMAGTYDSAHAGVLTVRKRAGLAAVEYAD